MCIFMSKKLKFAQTERGNARVELNKTAVNKTAVNKTAVVFTDLLTQKYTPLILSMVAKKSSQ